MLLFFTVLNKLKIPFLAFFDKRFTKRKPFIGDPNLFDEPHPLKHLKNTKTVVALAPTKHIKEINQCIVRFAHLSESQAYTELNSNVHGLTLNDVIKQQAIYGFNQIEQYKKLSWYYHLWLCYKNPFNLLLSILDIFFLVTKDVRGVVVITTMVIISTILRFFQEARSNKAADRLKDMVSTTATLIRQTIVANSPDGDNNGSNIHGNDNGNNNSNSNTIETPTLIHNRLEIPINQIVPGDIVLLSAGDLIPADCKIIAAKDLFISQAALTGESLPIEKFNSNTSSDGMAINPLELSNIVFMGTNVISGSATAIVIATGKNTIFGALADSVINNALHCNNIDHNEADDQSMIDKHATHNIIAKDATSNDGIIIDGKLVKGHQLARSTNAARSDKSNTQNNKGNINKRHETKFESDISRISWLLIYFMLIMSPIILVLNGVTKHDWMSAVMFALSIAVGLTPEMLPMIVTSTLAKGAVTMSKSKVIVKRLDAIQALGSMTLLCTDKTGTLTQDKICLERHTNIMGEEYDDVLEYAYLNSFYQTGLKNLLDIAVLERANFGDIPQLVNQYKKVDEVPFDFKRRRMSVVVSNTKNNNEHILICKGAVEELIACCVNVHYNNQTLPLSDELLTKLRTVTASLNAEGLRVVAVAIKKYTSTSNETYSYGVTDEQSMTLVGYIAFMDPPKETTEPALSALHNLGIDVKILTGDNELVAGKVCRDVGLQVEGILLGFQIEELNDADLMKIAKNTTIFAKLTPHHKERLVRVFKQHGHTVGFMGDGINDAPALQAADIGISVDSAVDIAKEAADIILLEKSLMVLEKGVEEGRKTFANMLKYIKITASSNFGNVFSVLIASSFLPFEPMLPMHLLVLNLLYDISQIAIPFDNVDKEVILKPQSFNARDLRQFIIFFGPLSSLFDIVTFLLLWYFYKANSLSHATFFQTGWFIESLCTQMMIVHMIRTRKIPFLQSVASAPMIVMMLLVLGIGLSLPMINISATYFKMQALPLSYFGWLSVIVAGYLWLTQIMKKVYNSKYTPSA